jgi:hypothetical protein
MVLEIISVNEWRGHKNEHPWRGEKWGFPFVFCFFSQKVECGHDDRNSFPDSVDTRLYIPAVVFFPINICLHCSYATNDIEMAGATRSRWVKQKKNVKLVHKIPIS